MSHFSGGWKVQIRVPADSESGENLLSSSWIVVFALCPHVVEVESESLSPFLRTLDLFRRTLLMT